MNQYDEKEYTESTMEPMRKRLDWVMFFHAVIWVAMLGLLAVFCR